MEGTGIKMANSDTNMAAQPATTNQSQAGTPSGSQSQLRTVPSGQLQASIPPSSSSTQLSKTSFNQKSADDNGGVEEKSGKPVAVPAKTFVLSETVICSDGDPSETSRLLVSPNLSEANNTTNANNEQQRTIDHNDDFVVNNTDNANERDKFLP